MLACEIVLPGIHNSEYDQKEYCLNDEKQYDPCDSRQRRRVSECNWVSDGIDCAEEDQESACNSGYDFCVGLQGMPPAGNESDLPGNGLGLN